MQILSLQFWFLTIIYMCVTANKYIEYFHHPIVPHTSPVGYNLLLPQPPAEATTVLISITIDSFWLFWNFIKIDSIFFLLASFA